MEKFLDLFYESLKAQLTIHGDVIWPAAIALTFSMAFITVMTWIVKAIFKKFRHSYWWDGTIRLMVLWWGVAFMYIHGLFFPIAFNTKQRIAIGVLMGCVNIVGFHILKARQKAKEKANGK